MKLEVCAASPEEFRRAIARPSGEHTMENYTQYMKTVLAEAEAARTEVLCFQSLELQEKNSLNFRDIGWIEKVIHDHLASHEYPVTIRILCDSDAVAEQYKVVYNFYYAGSKEERLQDERWD